MKSELAMTTLPSLLSALRQKFVPLLVVFVACLAVAQVNTFLYSDLGTSPSIVLPTSGVALAAIILEGYLILPAIALAAAVNAFMNGAPFLIAAGSVLANVLQPLVGYFILRQVGFDRKLGTIKDMFALLVVGLVVSMLGPAINGGTALLYNYLYDAARPIAWVSWWAGGALSMVVLTPLIIRWVKRSLTPRTRDQYIEIVGVISLIALTSVYLFGTTTTSVFGISLIFVLIALLFWLSFRAGPRFMTVALFVMTAVSLLGALYGTYEPTAGGLSERIFNTQVFDLFLAFFFFVLVSLEEQRKDAIKALQAYTTKLEDAVRRISNESTAKNEFLATLAHELRNPLAPLLSSVELLKLSPPSHTDMGKTLDLMHDRIRTMGYLLDDLLDISRITQRKLTLKIAPTELEELIRRAVEVSMPTLNQFKHTLTVTLPTQPLTIELDSLRMEQVILNLLHNAAKYTPPGGKIELTAEHKDNVLTLTVNDTGVGISPEMMDRIFEPFVQVNVSTKNSGGIGIGLALTKNLVEMHGGSISVQPGAEGVGTQFTVEIPAPAVDTRSTNHKQKMPRKKTPGAPVNILVVDDNEEAAESLARLLAARGHLVETAYTGIEALEKVERQVPEIVILDIGLPDIDGYEVAARLRAAGVHTALVALTGYGQDEDRQKAEAAGFDYHLVKPVGLTSLEPVLAHAINHL